MKAGYVVYVNSDPTNLVGIFFDANFPSGKTAQQAANEYASVLPVAADVRRVEIDDYQLIGLTDVNL